MSLDINVIRSSFEVVKPIANEAVAYFYQTLFTEYPQVTPMFKNVDMESQKRTLISALVRIVDGLDDLEGLTKYLRLMGGRHENYGVQDEHYAMVGKSLIMTFRHFFQDQWTQELEDQWIMAIGFIADQMIEGARTQRASNSHQAPQKTEAPVSHVERVVPMNAPHNDHSNWNSSHANSDLPDFVRNLARGILSKALDEELNGEFMKNARERASHILSQALKDEAEQLQARFSSSKSNAA